MPNHLVIFSYSFFLYIGAFLGWKAGSKVSLIMGITFGTLVLLGSSLTGIHPKGGFLFLLLISLILSGAFGMRLVKTKKMMPAGMLLIVSVAFCVFCLTRFLDL